MIDITVHITHNCGVGIINCLEMRNLIDQNHLKFISKFYLVNKLVIDLMWKSIY